MPEAETPEVEAVFKSWERLGRGRARAVVLLSSAEKDDLTELAATLTSEALLDQEGKPTDLGLEVARRLWYQRKDKVGFFGRPICRFPAHRPTDWEGSGGRLICGTCHPRPEGT